MNSLKIVYRDNLGYIVLECDSDGVQFLNGFAYFSDIYGEDHKIAVSAIVEIM